jgi:RimJ/RimL family protein N-acetyltransferase
MLGPILVGEHIRLEPPKPEHLPAFIRWFTEPELAQSLLYGRPRSAKQEEWLKEVTASEQDIVWAVLLKETGAPIGATGLERISWQHRHGWSWIVMGQPSAAGKEYAVETMRLRTAYAFFELGLEKVLTSDSGNQASRRALEEAGYRQCGLLRQNRFFDGQWHDEWLGEILREDWQA